MGKRLREIQTPAESKVSQEVRPSLLELYPVNLFENLHRRCLSQQPAPQPDCSHWETVFPYIQVDLCFHKITCSIQQQFHIFLVQPFTVNTAQKLLLFSLTSLTSINSSWALDFLTPRILAQAKFPNPSFEPLPTIHPLHTAFSHCPATSWLCLTLVPLTGPERRRQGSSLGQGVREEWIGQEVRNSKKQTFSKQKVILHVLFFWVSDFTPWGLICWNAEYCSCNWAQ